MAIVLNAARGSAGIPGATGAVAFHLSQPYRSQCRYRFDVRAIRGEFGSFRLGRFANSPPDQHGSPLERIVAVACCPGATEWEVTWDLYQDAGVPIADGALLELLPGDPGGMLPGVRRIAERYTYISDIAGTVNLLPGQTLTGWSAFATAAGASVQLNPPLGNLIQVPNGGAVSSSPGILDENLGGPLKITFIGTAGYLIELLESA